MKKNELIVSYDQDRRLALLEFDGDVRAWPALRRVCQDASEQAEVVGPTSIALPWWAFLGCRSQIDYHAHRRGFTVQPRGKAERKLLEADSVSVRYEEALNGTAWPEDAVNEQLSLAGFVRPLTHQQLRNICQLIAWPSGATFSVPGAGKTTEALALYALRRAKSSRLVVICPKNAFAVWEEQLVECLPNESKFVRLRGGVRVIKKLLASEPDKVLITYHQLPNVVDVLSEYIEANYSYVFLDESHRIKRGFAGKIGNSVLSISEIPDSKLIMSGTPMPNDISDLVPQFRFLYPQIPADETKVKQLISPIYVRTTKEELNLPEIRRSIVRISLKPAQYELYQLLKSETARQMKGRVSVRDRIALRKAGQSVLRLLQLVTNPALLSRIPFEHPDLLSDVLGEGDSPKLEYACYRARKLAFEGNKSIIWSSFVDNVELVAKRLLDLGAEYIHGGVEAGSEYEEGTREQKIKRFHDDPECYVLVANPAACGEGISLHTVCRYSIYLDRNYNAAQYLQSEHRVHRLGLKQHETTYVEILMAPDTVDESVDRRLTVKIDNMAKVLDDKSLHVEPEVIDLDSDGFDFNDFADFMRGTGEKAA